jgi:predicted ATPase/DNA-binding CsgD family transcriptional regulator
MSEYISSISARLTPFFGREQEIAIVTACLRKPEVRLLTLTGPGGVGKTRLSLQIAARLLHDIADRVRFVSLMEISDPDLVIPTIARAVGLREIGDQPLFDLLKAFLREKQLLLLLDNFEQVVAVASRLADLLAVCPDLKILVTSRAVLHISGEYEIAVPPLPLPDLTQLPEKEALLQYPAIALFLQCARTAVPDFQMTDANARTIAEICTHLDGLPLAIELAPPWLKLLSPSQLLARLEHRLQMLTKGPQDVPMRQQTLRNTLEWSYCLLDTKEKQLFRYLAVFVNGCTLQAIEALWAALSESDQTDQVLEGVVSLLDKSMLQRTAREGEEPRFFMLKTIREYGWKYLTTNLELESVQRAHAMHYLALVEEAELQLRGPHQAVWLERLEREHDNVRAALRWAIEQGERGESMEVALRLGKALERFWITRGHILEGVNLLKRALAADRRVAAATWGNALVTAAVLAYHQNDYPSAAVLYEESLLIFREQRDQQGIARSLNGQGLLAWMRGDYTAARTLHEKSLTISRKEAHQPLMAETLYHLAFTTFLQGDHATANSLIEEALQLFKKIGDQRSIAYAQGLKGLTSLQLGDAQAARFFQEEALAIFKKIGDQRGIAYALAAFGHVVFVQGDLVFARTLYRESLAITLQLGDSWMTAVSLEGLGRVVMAQGQPAWATQLWSTGQVLRETIGAARSPLEQTLHEQGLALVCAELKEQAFAALWDKGRRRTPEQILASLEATTCSRSPSAPSALSAADTQATRAAISPDGLTAREMDVLRLLAQGLTSAQIAGQLVISVVTVNFHVRSIYGKLAVKSRAAATRYAIEHHLV